MAQVSWSLPQKCGPLDTDISWQHCEAYAFSHLMYSMGSRKGLGFALVTQRRELSLPLTGNPSPFLHFLHDLAGLWGWKVVESYQGT